MKHNALTALALTLTLALGLSLTHADDAAQTRGEKGDVLTPLAMGNAWVYEGDEDELIATDRIEGVVLFDGQPWYLLRSYEHEKGQPENTAELVSDKFWITLKGGHEWDAWAELAGEDEVDKLELTMISRYYRYPATLGESYKPNADDPSIVVTITALNEKVKTKAGEFECVVYKETSTDDEDYTFTSYIAPGVGIVKTITVDEEGTYHSELIRYTLVEQE